MCSVDTPEPVEIERPTFVRNPFLDEDGEDALGAAAKRRGRSSLVIPTGAGIGFDGRGGTSGVADTGRPKGNSRNRNRNRSGSGSGAPIGAGGRLSIGTGGSGSALSSPTGSGINRLGINV